MTCRQAIEFIIDYLDRTLPEDELRLFEKHLAICHSCVAYLRTYEITIRMEKLVVQETIEVPEEMVRAILASRGV